MFCAAYASCSKRYFIGRNASIKRFSSSSSENNSSVRLNGNYGQPVSSYPEFDGVANYKITAVGTANPLVTLAYVARVDDCSDWPGGDPPPPPPFLYYKLEGCLVATDDCYYLTDQGQPNANQRFVGNDAGVTFFYTYTGDAGLANNPGALCAVQPVGSNTNCPPTPTPPVPPVPPTPTQNISVRECSNSKRKRASGHYISKCVKNIWSVLRIFIFIWNVWCRL